MSEISDLQVAPGSIRPAVINTATDLILPPTRAADRLRHFPENVYDLSPESHLSRFMKVLLGDSGAGQLRKRLMLVRMQSTLQGSRFFDLDRFYGALFGLRRSVYEVLSVDPFTSTATHDEWEQVLSKDASFRSRIEQFARSIAYGATPTGMELAAEALLSVDCDILESYIQADSGYQTYQELEDQYGDGTPGGFYSDMEDETYGTLEGYGLARLSGDDRRVFVVRPKRNITLPESYDLRRVLFNLKPADSRFIINHKGSIAHTPVAIGDAAADSEHWEVISKITSQASASNPYQSVGLTVEQPRPPLSGYQGEAWSYVGDLAGVAISDQAGVSSSVDEDGERKTMPTQRVTLYGGRVLEFSAAQAIIPQRMIQAGRVASDAILVSHPYSGARNVAIGIEYEVLNSNPHSLAKLYSDGIPLDALNVALKKQMRADPFQQNPKDRYWITPERDMEDETEETLEVRLSKQRMVNYITFSVSQFPHRVVVEGYDRATDTWVELFRQENRDSYPRIVSHGSAVGESEGHPLHSLPGHWMKISRRISPTMLRRVRLRMIRIEGEPPKRPMRRAVAGQRSIPEPIPYSLGVRGFDIGYRVSSREDFAFLDDPTFDGGVNLLGNSTVFEVRENKAGMALDGTLLSWRSEPQPVNYAVVNFYLDTRADGDGSVIDRFYLDPTHAGPHMTIYYSMDPEETDGTDEFYAERTWTPIPRDYTLQKGYVHVPTTRARYWKFEFTNLVAEPYETFLALNRRVRVFPPAVLESLAKGYGHAIEARPRGMGSAIDVATQDRYRDAIQTLGAVSTSDSPSEMVYVNDPTAQGRVHDKSWVWGFTPWHQKDVAPRFTRKGVHRYVEVDVHHNTKVGFFVGLREIEAYRSRWEADDDTMVYFDTFDDFRNLTAGFTWAFDTGYLIAEGGTPPIEATSRVFHSRNNVKAVQFATVQSPAVQLVPDHEFKDSRYRTYTWDDPDDFRRIGDAEIVYQESDTTVLNLRYVVPPLKALSRTGGIVQPIVQPPYLQRDFEVADLAAAEASEGGLESPLVGLSPEGRAYAAVRVILDTALSSPLILQIINDADESVLIEKEVTGNRGDTIEEYVALNIPETDLAVRVRLIQRGKSNDAWRVDALSLFDESMVWEFSNNGGAEWFPAIQVRNNEHGILSFPDIGNQLRYRVRAFRDSVWVSAIKIRPQYVGIGNARMNGTHRGPNVSMFDHDVPIQDDPLFTSWTHPIPYRWFAASRRFPVLPVEGIPFTSEFSRFFGRPIAEEVDEPQIDVTAVVFMRRSIAEYAGVTSFTVERPLPESWGTVRTIVHPVADLQE